MQPPSRLETQVRVAIAIVSPKFAGQAGLRGEVRQEFCVASLKTPQFLFLRSSPDQMRLNHIMKGSSAQYFVKTYEKRVWKKCIWITELLCWTPETLT